MNFRYSALICLFLFGQGHQVRGGEFRGVGEEIVGAATFAIVAVYAGGKVAKDIISGWLYGSKREQESAREAKEKEEREERERQLEWDYQLANQVAAERFAAQRQAEFDANNKAKTELAQKQTIYRNQISATLQDQESDLIHQFELYQEIEIQELLTHDLSAYQDVGGVGTSPHYMVKRVEALRDYVSGKDVWKEETYQVSTHGQLLLYEHGIKVADYQTYYGNQIQRALHQEFVEIIHEVADFRFKSDVQLENRKNIASAITEFADMGLMHNRAGYIIDGITYADFCYGVLDCLCVVGEVGCDVGTVLGNGAWKGVKNLKNKVFHPVETAKNAAKGFGNLILLIARLDQKMDEKMLELQQFNLNRRREDARNLASGKVTKEGLRARDDAHWEAIKKKLVKDVKVSLDAAWQQVNYQNTLHALEYGAECGVEAFLTGQALKLAGAFIGNACTGLDEFIEAGYGASTLGQLPCNGSSMQAVITYEAVIAHAAAEAAAEAARVAQVAGLAVAQVLDDASKLAPGLALMQNGPGGGPSGPVSGVSGDIDFIPPDIQHTTMLVDLPEIHTLFHQTRKGFGPIADKFIKMDVEHILEGEVITKVKGARVIKKLYGCHHDLLGYLEENNIIQLSDKIMGKFGTYKARVFGHNDYKCFFPKHWSRKEAISSIYEAYDNFLQSDIVPILKSDGKWEITGISRIGLKIKMFIDQSGVIRTAYPEI